MTDTELIAKQIQREQELNTRAFKKWKNELKEQEKKGDGGNTPHARKFMNYYFSDIVKGLEQEIDDPNRPRSSHATETIKRCLGVNLTYKKDKKTGEKIIEATDTTSQFDLDLSVFIALTLTIENAVMPAMKEKMVNKKSGQELVVFPAVDRTALIEKISRRVEQQIYFAYVQKCFPDFFSAIEKKCTGGGEIARSSSHYFRTNMMRAFRWKAEQLRAEGRFLEADAMEFKPFGSDRKHIGSWLLNGLIKYSGLFVEETMFVDGKHKLIYITLSPEAQKFKARYIAAQERAQIDDMPMLCPPVEATANHYGSWLLSSELLTPREFKGALRPSELFTKYINHLQSVPYRINPFIYELLDYLHSRNDKLGKFIPHVYQEPMDLAQALGIVRRGDYVAESKELKAKGEKFKDAKKTRSQEKARQLRLVEKGRRSKQIFRAMTELKEEPEFFYPHMWDFRGRAYCLCKTSPEPQGSDYQKAAVMFAEPQPIDHRTKFWLSIEIANNAGVDKVSFAERIKWVEHHLKEVELVATMFETDREQEAINYLRTIDEPFQFAAACEEYYRCFIAKDRKTTTIRVGVDMSCSAAGIHAGWKRDAYDAEAVNITPSNTPQDLYKRVWDKLVENNKATLPNPPIATWKLQKLTEKGLGRKIAKKMIMVFQYSAGLQKQMTEFYAIHDDDGFPEHLRLEMEEVKALRQLWSQTTDETMSVDSVIAWFQARVEELHQMGKTEILIPNATGSVQVMKYPLLEAVKQVKSFHNGRFTEYEDTGNPDLKAWKRAITANATHMCDSAIMCLALHDFPYAFSTIHDAAHTYATGAMDLMLDNLKEGYIKAVEMDIWDEFRKLNGLDIEPSTDFPKTNTLDLAVVRNSDYIFA